MDGDGLLESRIPHAHAAGLYSGTPAPMPKSPLSHHSVRMQRLALALTLTLLGALIGALVLIDFQHIRENEEEKLYTQTSLVASNMQLHMRSVNHVLEEILALQDFASPEEQTERMHSFVNAMPLIRGMGILDEHGRRLRGTRSMVTQTDFSDRPYFRSVLARPVRGHLYVSTPFQGVMAGVSVALSKAIIDQAGRFEGVVFAVLEPDYLSRLMESTLYADDMWGTLRHMTSGDIVRVGDNWRGEDERPTAQEIAYDADAVAKGRAVIQAGTDRPQMVATSNIVGYAGNADRPLMVAIGRDYHQAMAPWRRLAYLQGGLFLLFACAAVIGLLYYQHWRRQYEARRAADQRRLRARERNYHAILEHTVDCVAKLDAQGRMSYVNPSFCGTFGLTAAQAQGGVIFDHFTPADRDAARTNLDAAMCSTSERRFEARCDTPGGQRHMQWTLLSVLDDDGIGRSVLGVGHDVSEHIAMREQLRDRAHHDSLTGLANRGYFRELATAEISRCQRYGEPLTLLMADLDHFKRINDTRGHHAGDVALQTAARVLREQCRQSDVAARVGGEEFMMLLPNTATDEAVVVAERLRIALAAQAVVLEDGTEFHLTASIGVATLQPGESLHAVMQRADTALYAAKTGGRNRVEVADGRPVREAAH
jgi:diguanylate cyclase (GGDEF)-like protein/PAS domain S-box-containing protein